MPTPALETQDLAAQREHVAAARLAAFDFSPLLITDTGRWQRERVLEEEGHRYFCVLVADDPTTGATQRAQFNVFFAPGTAEAVAAYAGDWVALEA